MAMVSKSQSGDLNGTPLQFLEFPTMTASNGVVKKKLKIIASKRVEAETGKETCESGRQLSTGAHKRGTAVTSNCQKDKRRKMDRSVTQQCYILLNKLMTHPAGWVFNHPVDPVKLNIPDYFSIVTEPMDLGTIKTKLGKHEYFSIDEFAADVKLTFYNAMKYNPPDNDVHHMALELYKIFHARWKCLEAKWSSESMKTDQVDTCGGKVKNPHDSKPDNRKSSVNIGLSLKRFMSAEEKSKLREELLEVSRGKLPQDLRSFLHKRGLIFQTEENIKVDIDAFDDETLWELKRVIRSSSASRVTKTGPVKSIGKGGSQLSGKIVRKGPDSGVRIASGSATTQKTPSSIVSNCFSCGCGRCRCSLQNDSAPSSASGLSSYKFLGGDGYDGSRVDQEEKKASTRHMRTSDAVTNGFKDVCALDGERVNPGSQLSCLTSTVVSEEGCTPLVDVELSPKKALRAAKLKSRFADTIFKAQQKTLLYHIQDEKLDPTKMKLEKERVEMLQLKEKARIEAEIKAVEMACRRRDETELKLQREREREAARLALQKMEKTVQIDNNLEILKDLEFLRRCSLSDRLVDLKNESEVLYGAIGGGNLGNPLERLGLFMKDDYIGEEDEEAILNGDGEEGEILS